MGEIGDALELMHRAPGEYRTVQGVLRHRSSAGPMGRASLRAKESARAAGRGEMTVMQLAVIQRQVDPDERPWPALERVERDGLAMDIARPVPGLDAPLQVLVEREGTKIHLSSKSLDEDLLLRLAGATKRVAGA